MGLAICAAPDLMAQEQADNRDYQYALIEAVKQKNLGNLSEAVKLYKLVIKEKPDCAVAYYEVGSIYLATQQFEQARTNLKEAYTQEPENEWYINAYLNSLGAMDDYETAEEIIEENIKRDPENPEWEYKLAGTYFSMEKPKKAIRLLDKIEDERGFSEKITLLKASIYESDEKYEMALKEIEKVMEIFPEAIQFRVVAAELCLKNGNEDAAATYYNEILEVDSLNIFALTNLTDYYRQKEDYANSLRYLAKSFASRQIEVNRKLAILSYYLSDDANVSRYSRELSKVIEVLASTHPDVSDIHLLAADFYIQTQDYAHAYTHLKAYLELQKGSYDIYMQTIMLANAAGLNEELLDFSEQAQSQYPDSADIRFFKGIALYQLEEYEKLIHNFEGIPDASYSLPEYRSQAKMLIAEAYYRTENYEKSDSIFEEMIRQEPDNYTVLNNYSYYLAERGDKLEEAKKWSYDVIRNNPDNATFLDTYAWVLYKLKSFEEAEKYILFALDKGGKNDPEVNEHAGDIQLALGSYQIARSYYMKAIILGGDKEKLEGKLELIKEKENE